MEIKPVLKDKVDIGCGLNRREGYLRVDGDSWVNPDVQCNLNEIPWPLPDNTFNEIVCESTIEHLNDFMPNGLREMLRISKDGAKFRFIYPHFSCTFIEPDHKRAYGLHLLAHFKQYKVNRMRLEWSPKEPGRSAASQVLNKIFTFLANLNPYLCERLWCYWVGGFSRVTLEGVIDKSEPITDAWYQGRQLRD